MSDRIQLEIAFNKSMPTKTAVRANPNIWDDVLPVILWRSVNASVFMANFPINLC